MTSVECNKKCKNGIIIQVPPDVISPKTFREPRVYSWNANLLTTFSIYVIVYEQSLGFTNIINHIYGDYMHSKRVTFCTHSTLRIGTFDTLFSFIIYSCLN